nr:MAG TPA: hypothetical protein [Caudoviricetes sp.]
MMKMLSVIRRLESLEEYLSEDIPTEARHDDEETAEYRKDVEALSAAIDVLELLNRYKAEADKALRALRFCRTDPMDCGSCPYQGDSFPACAKQMDDDIEKLLVAAYAEGGESDDEQD